MIMDPLPGSNSGYHPCRPKATLAGVRRLCDQYGIILIFDEVQTGFGKTGKWFFCEHDGVTPDVMTIGKGFTGGFIPLGAAVTTARIAEVFRRRPGAEFRSGSTYGGHTVACAATLANLDLIEREELCRARGRDGRVLPGAVCRTAAANTRSSTTWRDRPALGGGSRRQGSCLGKPVSGTVLPPRDDSAEQRRDLVIAPSLIITRDEAEWVVELMDRAITAAIEEAAS